jgi:serine/threonine protein phosphatase 1
MFQFLKSFSGQLVGGTGHDPQCENVIKPDAPFYAVGDIHGRFDLLVDLLARIDPADSQQIIFLGDYIDRGPDSARTLSYLYDLTLRRPKDVICLMGNHERMMLDFIDDPLGRGSGWLRNGGITTLASFGIKTRPQHHDSEQLLEICSAFEAVLPASLIKWMRQLPLCWNSGNMWCVHGAMNPAAPPVGQRSKTMLWGHRDFLNIPRQDGACIIHGHTSVAEPTNFDSRIAVDTGAYRTDKLTGAYITKGQCDFISTAVNGEKMLA